MKTQKVPHFIIVLCLFAGQLAFAQAPTIEWQNTIGGNRDDFLKSALQTSDGGYMLAGYSISDISIDKTENSQYDDYWVVKVNSTGTIEWQNTLNGRSGDYLTCAQQTDDGGYILGGYSNSDIYGDKTEDSWGGDDYWILKLNSSGDIEWQKTIGGSYDDQLQSIEQTSDGGYILGGRSKSNVSGIKTQSCRGGFDYWVVKVTSTGDMEWQTTLGGNFEDDLNSIKQTFDGGYILGGTSFSSNTDDKTEASLGGSDYWVIKLYPTGGIEWQNTIGCSGDDDLRGVQQTTEGGYILGGYSSGPVSGDKTEVVSGVDYWVVKINQSGTIEWQNTIGGLYTDYLYSIQQTTDEGYILGGMSNSTISGDKTENPIYDFDYWVVRLDNTGAVKWDNTIGGNSTDHLNSVNQTADGGYILGGYSHSDASGDKNEKNYASNDYWVVKLYPDPCNGLTVFADMDDDGYGDIADPFVSNDCSVPSGYVTNSSDCNDGNSAVNPAANETCGNLIDDNCDGQVDENCDICTLPTNLVATDITSTSAKLTWNAVANAVKYKVRYKISGTSTWTTKSVTGTSKKIKDLAPSTHYIWEIKTFCQVAPNVTTGWSATQDFTTSALKAAESVPSIAFEIYPNPTSASANIHFRILYSSRVVVKVFDVNGKEIKTVLNQIVDAGDYSFPILTSQFSKGIYFIKMISDDGIQNQKLIVQ